ncbi:MAG: gluconate 2-dehydrogenase subunit 3 family protein [Acidimicrobiales bacterium]
MTAISRRQALQRGGIAGLALLLPADLLSACSQIRAESTPTPNKGGWLVFTDHEADVVMEATARLIPGPEDDPAEKGHPGAREAGVVGYIDTMLGALELSPAKVFSGGPFSNRAGWRVDDMATFIGLSPSEAHGWRARLAGYRLAYSKGVPALDHLAGGDFATAANPERDAALKKDPDGFMTLLFGHAIEGMYSCPEYGGNKDLVGWKDISFPGDVQPTGYTASEVANSDGPDRYEPAGVAAKLLSLIDVSSER